MDKNDITNKIDNKYMSFLSNFILLRKSPPRIQSGGIITIRYLANGPSALYGPKNSVYIIRMKNIHNKKITFFLLIFFMEIIVKPM